MAGIAEFERELIRERVRSGMAAAKARGKRLGRRPGHRPKSDRLAPEVLALVAQGRSCRLVGRELGLSKNTVAAIVGRARRTAARGRDVGLPAHYHDEDQVTFVVSGRRRFVMGGRVVALGAGECTLIPAGAAHRSLPEPDGVVCVNAYLPAG